MDNVVNQPQAFPGADHKDPAVAKLSQEFLQQDTPAPSGRSLGYRSSVWSADMLNGKYRNPVLFADYSDPDVIRVGSDYYMTASSFSCIPGLPILQSRDLVNWTLIGYALQRYPDARFDTPQHGKGVWAPSIRFHRDKYYIYWGDPDAGIFMVRADSPQGPWEEPVPVVSGKGLIDPCPLWDEDGKAYLIHAWAASRAGFNSILTVRSLSADGTTADPEGRHVFDGNDHQPTIEGPKFYKRNGYYYILAPAGGVKTGWQLALRSRDVYGPYEPRVVLQQGDTSINGPHQGGWVQTPSGQSWFLHFQDRDAYGRVVHLQPVSWKDDWPMMGRYNPSADIWEPVPEYAKPDCTPPCPVVNPTESDDFSGSQLGLQWQWQANPKQTWYALRRNPDTLRLFADRLPNENATLWDAGNLLLQRFPAPAFTATTRLSFSPADNGTRTGLVVMGKDYACLSLTKGEDGFVLSQRICRNADKSGQETEIAKIALSDNLLYLRVTVSAPEANCRFSYSIDGNVFHDVGQSFAAKPGVWVGAKVGLFCVNEHNGLNGGYADYYWFRVH